MEKIDFLYDFLYVKNKENIKNIDENMININFFYYFLHILSNYYYFFIFLFIIVLFFLLIPFSKKNISKKIFRKTFF
jgi:hypothetical protein